MKIRTSFSILIQLAKELSNAEKEGNVEKIKRAKEAHDSYRDLCLKSDSMSLNLTRGDLI